MTSHAAQRCLLWLCLAAYALASGGGFDGLVLCFGPRGHVAIEIASSGDCGGCIETHPACDEPEEHHELTPECPCDDVVLPGASLLTRKFDLDSAATRIPPAAPCVFTWSCAAEPRLHAEARASASGYAAVNRVVLTRPRSAVLLV